LASAKAIFTYVRRQLFDAAKRSDETISVQLYLHEIVQQGTVVLVDAYSSTLKPPAET